MSTVMTAVLAATGLLVGSLSATTAGAQGAGSGIEIEASQSLEWHSDQNIYVARGDARLRQGDIVVTADLLTADYRDRADGTTEIWRVTADGSVVVTTPTEQAHGVLFHFLVNHWTFYKTLCANHQSRHSNSLVVKLFPNCLPPILWKTKLMI